MKKLLLLVLFLGSAVRSYAGALDGEFLSLVPEGKNQFILDVYVPNAEYAYTESANDKRKVSGTDLALAYQYGLSKTYTFGGILGFASEKDTSDLSDPKELKTSGLKDIVLTFDSQWELSSNQGFFAGLALSLSPEKSKIDADSNLNEKWNATTGRTALTPYVAYQYVLGKHTFGSKWAYDLYKTDGKRTLTVAGTSTDLTVVGPIESAFSVFYESNLEPLTLGFSYSRVLDSKFEVRLSDDSLADSEPRQTSQIFSLYAAYTCCPNMSILPKINIRTTTADNLDKSTGNEIHLAFRSIF